MQGPGAHHQKGCSSRRLWHGGRIWGGYRHPKLPASQGCLLGATHPDNNPPSPGMPKWTLFLVLRGAPAQPSTLQWARSPTLSIEGPSHHGTSHRVHPTAAILTPPPGKTVIAELDLV